MNLPPFASSALSAFLTLSLSLSHNLPWRCASAPLYPLSDPPTHRPCICSSLGTTQEPGRPQETKAFWFLCGSSRNDRVVEEGGGEQLTRLQTFLGIPLGFFFSNRDSRTLVRFSLMKHLSSDCKAVAIDLLLWKPSFQSLSSPSGRFFLF